MKKLKIALIGTGSIFECHMAAYINNPDCEVVALCDINPETLKKKGEKYKIERCYADYNELLKCEKEVDAVSICTWNNSHAAIAIAALSAGKHVLCEKPMAMNSAEAEAMNAAAEKSGKILMIGFVRRFGNDAKIVEDFIKNGRLGEIYYAKAAYIRRNGNPGGWFGDKSLSGGGPLIDLGVHVIDLVRFLLGNPKPVSVYGATFTKLKNRPNLKGAKSYAWAASGKDSVCDVEDLASAMIRFDNGAVLSVETSFSLNTGNDEGKIELFGTKGGVKLDPEFSFYSEIEDYPVDVKLAIPTALDFNGLFQNEINCFVEAACGKTELAFSAADGIEVMRILDAIYLSAKTQREVVLKESLS